MTFFDQPRARTLAVLAMLAWGRVGMAQSELALSEKDFLSDMPIVLSVSRLPQRLDETPGAVTVLDRDTIRRSGARDVADLLRLVPGFQVSTAFENVAPLVSYHGAFDSYSNRLELLIDGRSAYSPYFIGSVAAGLQTVAVADIDRIEVLRGSNSAAYGARAILGMINIVTRHSADTLGSQAALTVGENGIRDAWAQVGWGGSGGTFRLSADRRGDDSLAGSNGQNRVARVNFRADLHPSAQDEVQLRFGTLSIDAGKGFVGDIDNPPHPTAFGADYAQLDWLRHLGADQDLLLRLSHSRERYEDKFLYSLRRLGIDDDYSVEISGETRSDVLSLEHTRRYGDALRLVWGGEFRSEKTVSKAAYNNDAALITDFSRLFGNLEWRAQPSVLVNLGAMAEHSSVSGDNFAPRLMVNWHATPSQTWRVGLSKALRPPSNYEQFADVRFVYQGMLLGVNTLASGLVQAENVLSREIGYLGDFPQWGVSVDVRAFHEKIDGFIRQRNRTLPRDYANDENFAMKGLEYQAKWKPWSGAEIVLSQSYTDIGAINYPPDSPLLDYQTGTRHAAPRWATMIAYFQKLPGNLNLNLTLTHQDDSETTLVGSGYSSKMARTRTDFRLAKSLRWGTRRGEVALVLQNLGLPYQDFVPSFRFERQAFVTLRLDN
ncbi:MAG: TonB-dependent receptor [Rhodoferax sp.]|nr:TonB-dependent receptor [Rhodoferax sp.]